MDSTLGLVLLWWVLLSPVALLVATAVFRAGQEEDVHLGFEDGLLTTHPQRARPTRH